MKKSMGQRAAQLSIIECIVNCILLAGVAATGIVTGSTAATVGVAAVGIVLAVLLRGLSVRLFSRAVAYCEGILDTIPFMMHATDMDMNWTFMNRATEGFLGLKRSEILGKHCSHWNAAICNTDRCSAHCLRNGKPTTFFAQNGLELRVDTNWLLDKRGERIGYVEVVQDITEMVNIQNEQKRLVEEIGHMCSSFVTASNEIAMGAQTLAQGSSEQTGSVAELSEAIAGIATEIDKTASQAMQAVQLADSIQQDAHKGSEQMARMTQAVSEINDAGQSISKVIKVIDDIAFQTNILALNAAVEAARAGQHGKGFAVVADEVRNLASKSAEAAKDTGDLIANSIVKAELGARISQETAESLQEIISGMQQSNRIVEEIATSAQQQSASIQRINESIDQVSRVVQQNSATSEQSAAASDEMRSQTVSLQHLLDQFLIEERGPETPRPVSPETGLALESVG